MLRIKDLFEKTKLLDQNVPNEDLIKEDEINKAQSNIQLAIDKVKDILTKEFKNYDEITSTEVLTYMEKLDMLKKKQLEYHQINIFENEKLSRTKQLKKIDIENTFDEYYKWYEDSLKAENKPFVKVIAVLMEV